MEQEGMISSYIEEIIPFNDKGHIEETVQPEEVKVSLSDHPLYSKYFKMLKCGIPLGAVTAKMIQEGVDPVYLNKPPTELIPLNPSKAVRVKSGRVNVKSVRIQNMGVCAYLHMCMYTYAYVYERMYLFMQISLNLCILMNKS
jgi:hypothetical protein